jgi:phenylacetate-CoA ligase
MTIQVELYRQALELAAFARVHSPYYRELYRDLPPEPSSFTEIPLVDRREYWAAVTPKDNGVATGPLRGVVIASGGTTGAPKYSVYGPGEWELTRKAIGFGGVKAGLKAGDRVANMGCSVEMYGSLIMNHGSLWHSPVDVLEFPIGEPSAPDYEAGSLRQVQMFGLNVLLVTTSTACRLAERYLAEPARFGPITIDTILCYGEALFFEQKALLERTFPGVRAVSAAHGATDVGPMGFTDSDCGLGEHRRSPCALLEIVDPDTGQVIDQPGRPGDLVVTNLVRRLMPAIRYPIGDRAQWEEPEGAQHRKYKFLGRTTANAALGGASIRYEELHGVIAPLLERHGVELRGLQVVLSFENRRDKMTMLIAAAGLKDDDRAPMKQRIYDELRESMESVKLEFETGYVHPLEVEWVAYSDLTFNKRSGKLLAVIDRRFP